MCACQLVQESSVPSGAARMHSAGGSIENFHSHSGFGASPAYCRFGGTSSQLLLFLLMDFQKNANLDNVMNPIFFSSPRLFFIEMEKNTKTRYSGKPRHVRKLAM